MADRAKQVGVGVSLAAMRKEVARDVAAIEKEYQNREITPHAYRLLMREQVHNKTRAEWKKVLDGRLQKQKQKDLAKVVPVFLVIVALSMLAFFTPFVGFVTITEQNTYTENVDERFATNSTIILNISHPGTLSSLHLTGSISKKGIARVYAELGNSSYLVYDSQQSGLSDITGLVVAELDNSTENVSLVVEVVENASLSMRFIAPDQLVAHTDEYLEYGVTTDEDVDEEYLCSVWSVNARQVACQGSVDCCSFVGLEAQGAWDAPFYLAYDRYQVEDFNTIAARLVYYNLDLESFTSDIRYSLVAFSTAEFIERRILIADSCLEACLLPSVDVLSIVLRIEIETGSLDVDDITYSLLQEFNISTYAPVLAQKFSNITLHQNSTSTLNLDEYFTDEDGDALNYTFVLDGDLEVLLDRSLVFIEVPSDSLGKAGLYFTANDGHYSASSNVLWIDVIEKPATPDEVNVTIVTIKPSVRLNSPVRWVMIINSSEDTINLSLNITADILNITIVDLSDNGSLVDVTVRDEGKVKNLSLFAAEKRIDHISTIEDRLTLEKLTIIRETPSEVGSIREINKKLVSLQNELNQLTGYVVAIEYGDGLLPKFFAWLRGAGITGFAVAEAEDTGIAEIVISDVVREVVIEYYTAGPTSVERMLTNTTKEVVISSDVHYEDIVAYTVLPREIEENNIVLHWIVNGTRTKVDFVAVDRDHNGLVDEIEWIVPHLSNQTYEISLEVLNIQSYPPIGGEWTIRFETSGMADLTIEAVNGTRYRELSEDNPFTQDDLYLKTLRCGTDVVFDVATNTSPANGYLVLENRSLVTLNDSFGEVYAIAGYRFLDYSCNLTARHTVHVVTAGRHYQNISFGNITTMAQNSASGIACRLGTGGDWGEGCYENTSTSGDRNSTDTCIDLSADNQISTADRCHNNTECIDHIGASCDYYNSGGPTTTKGVCARDSGTAATCQSTSVAGEFGTNLKDGTAVNFHSGNENTSCSDGSQGMVCQDSSGGYQPNGTAYCIASTCSVSVAAILNCAKPACAVSDITIVNLVSSCSSTEAGWACDSSTNGSGFNQDGICDGSACKTSGYLCNASAIIYADACGSSCSDGDVCDATLTNGNFNGSYGTCSGSSCAAANANIAPALANVTMNDSGGIITTHDDLYGNATFTDQNGDNGSVHFTWFVNGTAIFNETIHGLLKDTIARSNLSRTNLTRGLTVNFSAYANDSTLNSSVVNSATITVANGAPSVSAPTINTSSSISRSNITVNTTYTDIDGDVGNVTITMKSGASLIKSRTVFNVASGGVVVINFSRDNFQKGTTYKAFANATDATDNSDSIEGTNVSVTNTPANVSTPGLNNSAPSSTDDLYAEANYSDYDGGEGIATLYWEVNSVVVKSEKFTSLDSGGANVFSVLKGSNFNKNDKVNFTVVANDTEDNTTITSITLTISGAKPTVGNIIFNYPDPVTPEFKSSENMSLNASFFDADNDNGSLTFTWYKNGTAIFNETIFNLTNGTLIASNLTIGNYTRGGLINVSIVANDTTSTLSSTYWSVTETIVNGLPIVARPILNTSSTISRSNVSANTTYFDQDGDIGNVTILLTVDEVEVESRTVYNVVSGSVVVVNFSKGFYNKGTTIVSQASARDEQGGISKALNGTNATVTNTLANVSVPGLNNSLATSNDHLYVEANYSDFDRDTGTAVLYWLVNNVVVKSEKFTSLSGGGGNVFSTLTTKPFKKNDILNVTLVANDTEDNTTVSAALTILNGPPTVANISFHYPNQEIQFRSNQTVRLNALFYDSDGDNGSLIFVWFRNGSAFFNETIPNLENGTLVTSNVSVGNYTRTDIINATITANDTDLSDIYHSGDETIVNGPATLTALLLNDTTIKAKDVLGFNTTVTDPDGDLINVTFDLLVDGTPLGGSTDTKVTSGQVAIGNSSGTVFARSDVLIIQAYGKDGGGGTSGTVISVNITVINSPPFADNLTVNDTNIRSVDDVNVQVNYSDDDGDGGSITFRWYINSTPVFNETITGLSVGDFALSANLDANNFTKGDRINVSATGDDTFDNGTPLFSDTFTILNSPPFLNNSLSLSIGKDNTKSITLLQFFADPDGDPLSFNVTGNDSAVVQVVINETTSGTVFTPAAGYTGTSTVTIVFNDSEYNESYEVDIDVQASVSCGDGFCGASEATSCKADCDFCGDDSCNAAETCNSCKGDCGACPVRLSSAAAPAPAAAVAAPPAAAVSVSLASPAAVYGLALSASTLPCRRVSGGDGESISIHQAAIEEDEIPEGFAIVLDPFQIQCAGQQIDFTVSIPKHYVNLTMLKCTGGKCSPTVLNLTDRLECFDSETGKLKREEDNITSEGGNLTDGELSVAGAEVVKSNRTIAEAENEFLKIIGKPLQIRVEGDSSQSSVVTLTYLENLTKNIDVDGLQIFARVNNEWDPLGGRVDKDKHTVTVELEEIDQYLDEDRIGIFAILGTICEFCLNSSFELVYNGTTRDAVLLVHGFTSSPDTFADIIADIKLTEQPFQTWTFGYSSSRPIADITQDLMDSIELNVEEFDNLYIAAHSLGGIVAQKTLFDAFTANSVSNRYTFIPKVKKVILVGVPNEGAAFLDDYLKVYKFLVNRVSKYNNLFNVNDQLIDILKEGIITPRLPNVDYFVIAGTNTRQFGSLLEIEDSNETHDGLVTVRSAQRVGTDYIMDRCTNYWDINVTHTGLIDEEVSRKLIEQIIAREIIASGVETAVGNTNYYDLRIDSCSSRDRYILVGQRISDAETFDATGCKCGNGVCGQGEDQLNCPADCFTGFNIASIPWKPVSQGTGMLILVSLLYKGLLYVIIRRSVSLARFRNTHRLLKKHIKKKHVRESIDAYHDLQRHYAALNKRPHNFLVNRHLWRKLKKHHKALQRFEHPLFKMKMLRKTIRSHLRKGDVRAAQKAHIRMHRLYIGHFTESAPRVWFKKPGHFVKLVWRSIVHPPVHMKHHYARMRLKIRLRKKTKS